MRGQGRDWENICAQHLSIKGLVSKIFKELLKLNNKKTHNPIKKTKNNNNNKKKQLKDLNRYLTKNTYRYQINIRKRYSTLHVIREIQIKTMRSPYTCQNVPNPTDNTTCQEDMEQWEFSFIAGGRGKCYSSFGIQFDNFIQN